MFYIFLLHKTIDFIIQQGGDFEQF